MARPHVHPGVALTTAPAQARDTPGRAPGRQHVVGVLVVDAENVRARYECYRPGCPKPREEPIRPSAIKAFIDGIKARHLSQYHEEQR
ncbi:hypothetical protein [Streptomyces shenzhenensis]|uniref:Uncharacterized protein n=1 Tax=Streptomyces shenzhenensis TaxID=943815 RepID=A0A3M0HZR0_9ACTN|nr:hypothetical protein [Streptomyces shenzhenensis]RMB81302.1 hypothetical protein CTZ28_35475 [Streptomyces shenzhenensis]